MLSKFVVRYNSSQAVKLQDYMISNCRFCSYTKKCRSKKTRILAYFKQHIEKKLIQIFGFLVYIQRPNNQRKNIAIWQGATLFSQTCLRKLKIIKEAHRLSDGLGKITKHSLPLMNRFENL